MNLILSFMHLKLDMFVLVVNRISTIDKFQGLKYIQAFVDSTFFKSIPDFHNPLGCFQSIEWGIERLFSSTKCILMTSCTPFYLILKIVWIWEKCKCRPVLCAGEVYKWLAAVLYIALSPNIQTLRGIGDIVSM